MDEKVGGKRVLRSAAAAGEDAASPLPPTRARIDGSEKEEGDEQQPPLPSVAALTDKVDDEEGKLIVEEEKEEEDLVVAEEEEEGAGVAAILRRHLLGTISDENDRLREENEGLVNVLASLAMVQIRLGSGNNVIVADLSDSYALVNEDEAAAELGMLIEMPGGKRLLFPFHQMPSEKLADKQITVDLKGPAVPLADLKDIAVIHANQKIGEFREVYHEVLVNDKNQVSGLILLAQDVAVRTTISGLGNDDVERFRDGAFGSDQLREYILTGAGLQAENATVTIFGLDMFVRSEIGSVLEILAPICMCPNHPDNSSLLNAKRTDFERLRRKIIATVGGNGAQTKALFSEGKELQIQNVCVKAMREILGTVGLMDPSGAFSLSLEAGNACKTEDNEPIWVVECSGNFSLQPEGICHHSASLSATPLFIDTIQTARDEGPTMMVRITYHSGVVAFGECNKSDVIDSPVKLNAFVFPFALVRDTLDVLGVDDYCDCGCPEECDFRTCTL